MLDTDHATTGERGGLSDDVVEFAHVARPGLPQKQVLGRVGDGQGPVQAACRPTQGMTYELRQVDAALSHRGQGDADHTQPIEQIVAESTGGTAPGKVGGGGGHHPHHGPFVVEPGQSRLIRGGQLIDVIEQDGAASRRGEGTLTNPP